jgi:hypothetical protein
MKRAALLLLLCGSLAYAQQPTPAAPARAAAPRMEQRVQAPTYSDLYCAGFITDEPISHSNYVIAGTESFYQTEFHEGDYLFLEGTAYTEGSRFSVLRPLRDPNRRKAFTGQSAAISALGQPYEELGRVRVTAVRGKSAVAKVEFSCDPIVPGDYVVPFQEKTPLAFRKVPLERFPAAQAGLTARIVMAKDFDYVLGTGHKVYLNAGADKGVKIGDYFSALRNFDPGKMNEIDSLSLNMPQTDDTQKEHGAITKSQYADLPREAIAQMIVLNVTPKSSTAMITYALENVNVGDAVELESAAQK